MKHYLIIRDYTIDYENTVEIIGIAYTMRKAKKIFNENVVEDMKYAEDKGFIIHTDEDTEFDAGEEGCYIENHTNLHIKIV